MGFNLETFFNDLQELLEYSKKKKALLQNLFQPKDMVLIQGLVLLLLS